MLLLSQEIAKKRERRDASSVAAEMQRGKSNRRRRRYYIEQVKSRLPADDVRADRCVEVRSVVRASENDNCRGDITRTMI